MPEYSLSRLMTVEETAEYLGMSSKSVDRHRRAGDIAYVQKGRYVRIRFGDLLAAIERWTRSAVLSVERPRSKYPLPVVDSVERKERNDRLTDVYGLALSLAGDRDESGATQK